MHIIAGEGREKARQIAGGKHTLGRGKRKARHFSGVSMPGVFAELQGDQCGLGRGRKGRVAGDEIREEAGGSIMLGGGCDVKDLGFYFV